MTQRYVRIGPTDDQIVQQGNNVMDQLDQALFVYGGVQHREIVAGAVMAAMAKGWRDGCRYMAAQLGVDMSGDGIVLEQGDGTT
jgi:hypothetical protein